jgi:hypothetical protein
MAHTEERRREKRGAKGDALAGVAKPLVRASVALRGEPRINGSGFRMILNVP